MHKLIRKGKFEHSHTSFTNLQRGFPAHLRGKVKEMSKELLREGVLILKQTNYGRQVSINLEKKERILEYIDEFFAMD